MDVHPEPAFLHVNGVRLHVVQAGLREGPLVILLHGFPEFWYAWREQLPYLVAAGFRVWIPDQRGYNLSDKPNDVADYSLDLLADDIGALIEASGRRQAYVIGHDSGGVVAWWLAQRQPERVHRLVIVNAPHVAVLRQMLPRPSPQWRRSAYMGLFQIPWLPEALLRMGNWRMMVSVLRRSSYPNTFNSDDLVNYREAWSQPGAITGMLNWYRALRRFPPSLPENFRIQPPTLLIWGKQDRFLGDDLARSSIALCERGRLELIDSASHWIQHEQPQLISDLIGGFLHPQAA